MNNGHTQTDMTSTIDSDVFGSNTAAALVYKKAEKILTALYMATNHIKTTEPLRLKVRDIAGSFLSDTLQLRNSFTQRSETVVQVLMHVQLLISLLDTLHMSGLLSKSNAHVLQDALADFAQRVSALAQRGESDSYVVTPDYFSLYEYEDVFFDRRDATLHNDGTTVAKRYTATQQSLHTTLPAKPHHTLTQKNGVAQKQRTAQTTVKKAPTRTTQTTRKTSTTQMGDRLHTIVDFITKRGSASVGDIAQLIVGCSTKTLQRDLQKLLARGVLRKEGEKRWTRYSIAQ